MKLPELQHLEDPQNQLDERATHPLAMALRNAGVALLGIALTGGVYWLKLQSQGNARQPLLVDLGGGGWLRRGRLFHARGAGRALRRASRQYVHEDRRRDRAGGDAAGS